MHFKNLGLYGIFTKYIIMFLKKKKFKEHSFYINNRIMYLITTLTTVSIHNNTVIRYCIVILMIIVKYLLIPFLNNSFVLQYKYIFHKSISNCKVICTYNKLVLHMFME